MTPDEIAAGIDDKDSLVYDGPTCELCYEGRLDIQFVNVNISGEIGGTLVCRTCRNDLSRPDSFAVHGMQIVQESAGIDDEDEVGSLADKLNSMGVLAEVREGGVARMIRYDVESVKTTDITDQVTSMLGITKIFVEPGHENKDDGRTILIPCVSTEAESAFFYFPASTWADINLDHVDA